MPAINELCLQENYGHELHLWPTRAIFSKVYTEFPVDWKNYDVDSDQACELLNISKWTLYAWIRQGRLKAVRIKGAWHTSLKEISEFYMKNTPRKYRADEHRWWTKQEIEMLKIHGTCPNRSALACRIKRSRLRYAK